MTELLVSVSPHVRHPDSTAKIMWSVVFALLPAAAWGVWVFGYPALVVLAISTGSAILIEAFLEVVFRKPLTIADGSAAVTGLLLGMILPSNAPWFVALVGSAIAVAIAKQAFGGIGYNIWNPALIGRAFVQVAYPAAVSQAAWPKAQVPSIIAQLFPVKSAFSLSLSGGLSFDSLTAASPLSIAALKEAFLQSTSMYRLTDLFLGLVPGSIGEVSKLALLAGGIFLIARNRVNWRAPVFYILTFAILTFALPGDKIPGHGYLHILDAANLTLHTRLTLYHVLSGGLLIGAFFMATDMVTTPITNRGLMIFGIGCGLMTAVIRLYGGYPEGVCYSILLMNTATPLIDRFTRPKVFGERKRK